MTRLRPIVERRGFAVGAAQLRVGHLFYAVLLTLATAVGTIAAADVVHSIVRPL
jgi:hypothetical protein